MRYQYMKCLLVQKYIMFWGMSQILDRSTQGETIGFRQALQIIYRFKDNFWISRSTIGLHNVVWPFIYYNWNSINVFRSFCIDFANFSLPKHIALIQILWAYNKSCLSHAGGQSIFSNSAHRAWMYLHVYITAWLEYQLSSVYSLLFKHNISVQEHHKNVSNDFRYIFCIGLHHILYTLSVQLRPNF